MRRRELDARVLAALGGRAGVDPARLVHHARRAGDDDAILRGAPAAARAAAAAGAARPGGRALPGGARGGGRRGRPTQRAELLEGLSVRGLPVRRPRGGARHPARGAGDPHGPRPDGRGRRGRALAVAPAVVGGPAGGVGGRGRARDRPARAARPDSGLAMAYSTLSQLMMLAWRTPEAVEWGGRAIDMARELGDRERWPTRSTTWAPPLVESRRRPGGTAMLEEAIAIATADGQHDHAVRAHRQPGLGPPAAPRATTSAFAHHRAGPRLRPRATTCASTTSTCSACGPGARLDTGDWAGAEEDGRAVMAIDAFHPAISALPGHGRPRAASWCGAGEPEGDEPARRGVGAAPRSPTRPSG